MNLRMIMWLMSQLIADIMLLNISGTSLVACYPIGHKYHTPNKHAQSMLVMPHTSLPNIEFLENQK